MNVPNQLKSLVATHSNGIHRPATALAGSLDVNQTTFSIKMHASARATPMKFAKIAQKIKVLVKIFVNAFVTINSTVRGIISGIIRFVIAVVG